ncbi:hypothetical protein WP3W19E03_00690 [Aeromonas veronii]|uniref:Uncharacterized protein n=2 Tax=Aeromonas TaxID=642 RepID=A0A6S5YML6_AERVE|nr:hypothetical protein C6C11_20360 [Aeromonas hydrophila]BBR37544.1 hypothetical protein WP3W19E03_00690 [Aeromonas veronii]BBU02731.1 hypothetical protein WP9W18E04_00700 [Aeromonas veronii]
MPNYVINKNSQSNGDHEIHNTTSGCSFMPNPENRIDLGYHDSCHGAVIAAKAQWPNNKINGCYYCCNACHTS